MATASQHRWDWRTEGGAADRWQGSSGDIQCPCCDQVVPVARINEHLDGGCDPAPRSKRARMARNPHAADGSAYSRPTSMASSNAAALPSEKQPEAVLEPLSPCLPVHDSSQQPMPSGNSDFIGSATRATKCNWSSAVAVAEATAADAGMADATKAAKPAADEGCAEESAPPRLLGARTEDAATDPTAAPSAGPVAGAAGSAPGGMQQSLHRLRGLHEEIDWENTPGAGWLLARQVEECELLLNHGSTVEGSLEEAFGVVEGRLQGTLENSKVAVRDAAAASRAQVAQVCEAVREKASSSMTFKTYVSLPPPQTYQELCRRNQLRDKLWLAVQGVMESTEAMHKGVAERDLKMQSMEQDLLGFFEAANDRLIKMKEAAEQLFKDQAKLMREETEQMNASLSETRPQIHELNAFVQRFAEEVANETAEGREAHRQALERYREEETHFVRMNECSTRNPSFATNQEGIANTEKLQEDLEQREEERRVLLDRWAALMAGMPGPRAEGPPEPKGQKRKWGWPWPWRL